MSCQPCRVLLVKGYRLQGWDPVTWNGDIQEDSHEVEVTGSSNSNGPKKWYLLLSDDTSVSPSPQATMLPSFFA